MKSTPRSSRYGSLALALGLGLASTSCRSAAGDPSSHWNADSVGPRITKHLTGYRRDVHGSYLVYQAKKKRDVNLTLRRHFLNDNPTNPFQVHDPDLYAPLAPHSPFRDPLGWFGFDGIAMGFVTLGWSGTYLPLPLDSLIALGSPGGWSQFWGSGGLTPPKPSTFEVKNR